MHIIDKMQSARRLFDIAEKDMKLLFIVFSSDVFQFFKQLLQCIILIVYVLVVNIFEGLLISSLLSSVSTLLYQPVLLLQIRLL